MFAIVINQEGYKVEFVALNEDGSPQYYELKEGESLIEKDWDIANTMNKPIWSGSGWAETEHLPPEELPPPIPSEGEIRLTTLEAKVETQDAVIEDILFEILPGLTPEDMTQTMVRILYTLQGGNNMAGYLAQKIIEGRDYATVFKTSLYKRYQDDVDTILELEGRADLIKR